MTEPKFKIGDEVFVRDPSRYYAGCACIVGIIDEIIPMGTAWKYAFDAEVGFLPPGRSRFRRVAVHEVDVVHRIGIPLSQVTGADLDRMQAEWSFAHD